MRRLTRPAAVAIAVAIAVAASAVSVIAPPMARADGCSLLGGKTSNGTTVTVTGSVDCTSTSGGGGGGGGGSDLPPCWLAPRFTGQAMYDLMNGGDTGGLSSQQFFLAIPRPGETDAHKSDPPTQGLWWVPVSDGTAEGDACAYALYWPVFAPPPEAGGPGNGLPVMDQQRASDMAMNHLKLPTLNITLSPAAATYVNLPTWVYSNPRYQDPVSVTATISIPITGVGVYTVSATITAAETSGLQIQSAAGGASITDSGCRDYGSNAQGGNLTCGVIFKQPTGGKQFPVTVSTTWHVTGPGVDTTRTDTDTAFATVREIQTQG